MNKCKRKKERLPGTSLGGRRRKQGRLGQADSRGPQAGDAGSGSGCGQLLPDRSR